MEFESIIGVIRKQMADGDTNWHMPWHGKKKEPINVSKGVPYKGINQLLLWAKTTDKGYKSKYWGTFSQWRQRKQPVNKGEKGTVLLRPHKGLNLEGTEELKGFRWFHVFNGDQVLNRDENHPDLFGHVAQENVSVEGIVDAQKADIRSGYEGAFYHPVSDYIEMPPMSAFVPTKYSTATQNYYSTLLHELVHWTGHTSRTDRNAYNENRRVSYAFEELVAELGAAFLCAKLDLEDVPRKDHAQYLNNWLHIIDDKPSAFWRASSLAQQGVEFILNRSLEDPEDDDSLPDWFTAQPTQIDMLAPKVLGT